MSPPTPERRRWRLRPGASPTSDLHCAKSAEVYRDAAVEALRDAGAAFALVFGSRARRDHCGDFDLDIGGWWPTDAAAAWDVAVPDGVDLVVLTAWERLADFDSFVSQLSEWLAAQRE